MYKSLSIDSEAAQLLSYSRVTDDWFSNGFNLSSSMKEKLHRYEQAGHVYLVSKGGASERRFLVVNLLTVGLCSSIDVEERVTAFERMIVVALSKITKAINPSKSWGKYESAGRLSIYASRQDRGGDGLRLYFDTNPADTNNIYVYEFVNGSVPFDDIRPDEDIFTEAYVGFDAAIADSNRAMNEVPSIGVQSNIGIELTTLKDLYPEYAFTLEDWYLNRLTSEQRDFVDKPLDQPIRLKGAAGTGKTLALAVRFLKIGDRFERDGIRKRILFVTHSSATAQLVGNIVHSMKEGGVDSYKKCDLKIASLYDFAQDLLNYSSKDLHPVSTDGVDGRVQQFLMLSDVLGDVRKDFVFQKNDLYGCSDYLVERLNNSEVQKDFAYEVLNEFASVLDAENIIMGTSSAERYLTCRREAWQMALPSREDRMLILKLHQRYKQKLKNLGMLSLDQMVADLNRYLSSHEWDHLKDSRGFDYIFVDELHCFTKAERMVFHDLFRMGSEVARLPLYMAYDTKQVVGDGYLNELASSLISSTKVGKTDLVELTKVFRYTKEISQFLNDVDGSFPALNLQDEWQPLHLISDSESGVMPILRCYDNSVLMTDDVFRQADKFLRKDKKKSVAVLIMNDDIFRKYYDLGRIKKYNCEVIASRDEAVKVNRVKGRPVISMPEYVAGLQFDSVYILNVDKADMDSLCDDESSCGIRRRFVSQLYLGCSRAKEQLVLCADRERGGATKILDGALQSGSLRDG